MSQLRPSQEREREETRKRRLERKKDGDFVLVQLIHFIFFFFLNESIFISFRCNFYTQVHLACGSLQFFFFLKKVLGVCFNKDGDFVLVQLIHFIFFFYLMKLYLFHLDVASPDGSYMWIIIFLLAGLFFFFFSLGESLVGLF